MLTILCFTVPTHESHVGFLFSEWHADQRMVEQQSSGIEAHSSATKLQGSKYMIQQQNYRDQSLWFAKISDQVVIYLRHVHVTMPYALTHIANCSQCFFCKFDANKEGRLHIINKAASAFNGSEGLGYNRSFGKKTSNTLTRSAKYHIGSNLSLL